MWVDTYLSGRIDSHPAAPPGLSTASHRNTLPPLFFTVRTASFFSPTATVPKSTTRFSTTILGAELLMTLSACARSCRGGTAEVVKTTLVYYGPGLPHTSV